MEPGVSSTGDERERADDRNERLDESEPADHEPEDEDDDGNERRRTRTLPPPPPAPHWSHGEFTSAFRRGDDTARDVRFHQGADDDHDGRPPP